jgi:phosphatidylethanolamine/phosphatidyl-N-methylethanolamine N-methyltransferase
MMRFLLHIQESARTPVVWVGKGCQDVHTFHFLKQFVTRPTHTGAICPSSQDLAEAMTDAAHVTQASVIVEFGPGTGVFTEVILRKMNPVAIFLAMEINPEFVRTLRKMCPRATVFHDSAENTRKYLNRLGVDSCDSIVSGLPWAGFKEDVQDSLLDVTLDVLRARGHFATFIYVSSIVLPAGIRFRAKLNSRFRKVTSSHIVWKNLPPAIVLHAEK